MNAILRDERVDSDQPLEYAFPEVGSVTRISPFRVLIWASVIAIAVLVVVAIVAILVPVILVACTDGPRKNDSESQ